MVPIIYADVLVALNWLIDYLLLTTVSVWLRIPVRRWRVVLAALLGGLCACLIFLPPLSVALQLLADMALVGVLVITAFSFDGFWNCIKRVAALFFVSAAFSGVITVLSRLVQTDAVVAVNGQLYADISPLSLALLAGVSYGLLRLYERITRKTIPRGGEYRLRVEHESGVYEGRALHDTGLHLREPFSGAPVIVVEKAALSGMLSKEMQQALSAQGGEWVRMIPYRSVGGNGLLPAFRPHRAVLCRGGGKERDITGTYVAVTESLGRGEYEALVGNDLMM